MFQTGKGRTFKGSRTEIQDLEFSEIRMSALLFVCRSICGMVIDLQNRLFKDTSESNVSLMKEGDRERALLCSAYFVVFI